MRLLFITKQRGTYASSGLRNFVRFIVDMMTEMGVEVKAVDVIPRTANIAPPPASSTFPPSVAGGTGHPLPIIDDQRQGTSPSTFAGGLFLAFFSTLVVLLFLPFLCILTASLRNDDDHANITPLASASLTATRTCNVPVMLASQLHKAHFFAAFRSNREYFCSFFTL